MCDREMQFEITMLLMIDKKIMVHSCCLSVEKMTAFQWNGIDNR